VSDEVWYPLEKSVPARSNASMVTYKGVTMPVADWARASGRSPQIIIQRLRKGWTHQEAIEGRKK